MRLHRTFVPLIALVYAGACGSATGPEWVRALGVIDIGGATPPGAFVVPDTVAAGEPFDILVTTFGSSTCVRPADTEVRVEGLAAEVAPFMERLRGDVVCTDDLRHFPREVSLTLPAPGEALVRVRGTTLDGQHALREFPVVVVP